MFKTLIVDDNVFIRESLNEILSSHFPAMEIAQAADGKEAMEKVDNLNPDLVFMDIKLPDQNGLVLTRIIKVDHSATVVIVITAYDMPEYRQAAFLAGASFYIPKGSLSGDGILEVVESILLNPNYH